jgi:hypothetical protein
MTIEEEFRFDTRIRERMLKKGLIAEPEVAQRLEALSDLSEQTETVELEQPGLAPRDSEAQADKEAP